MEINLPYPFENLSHYFGLTNI